MRNLRENKKIIIAPLNWGLGHATRCIPIIRGLITKNFIPIVASDGDALELLQLEFPNLKSYELPSYNIQYTKNGRFLKYKLLFDTPKYLKTIAKEQQVIDEIIKKENIKGIISDNRFGVRSNKIPSAYISHQINVLSGNTTFLSSKIHQNLIAKFDTCWVPDYKGKDNLAGKLSHGSNEKLNLKYIGPISRFELKTPFIKEMTRAKKQDLMVILSGPEPQRSLLENKLLDELKSIQKKVLFVRGLISDKGKTTKVDLTNNKHIVIVNFMQQKELQTAITESKIIISRSGYTTIMDLEKLSAKAFFIPTPGQNEQEYLAKRLERQNIAPFSSQEDFKIGLIENCNNYFGFTHKKTLKQIENQFPFDVFH